MSRLSEEWFGPGAGGRAVPCSMIGLPRLGVVDWVLVDRGPRVAAAADGGGYGGHGVLGEAVRALRPQTARVGDLDMVVRGDGVAISSSARQ